MSRLVGRMVGLVCAALAVAGPAWLWGAGELAGRGLGAFLIVGDWQVPVVLAIASELIGLVAGGVLLGAYKRLAPHDEG